MFHPFILPNFCLYRRISYKHGCVIDWLVSRLMLRTWCARMQVHAGVCAYMLCVCMCVGTYARMHLDMCTWVCMYVVSVSVWVDKYISTAYIADVTYDDSPSNQHSL